MAEPVAVWTCPVCGERAPGTGREGLWPPREWQVEDGGALSARCPAHVLVIRAEDVPSPFDPYRWFPGPFGL